MKVESKIFLTGLIILGLVSCGGKSGSLLLSGVLETDDYDLIAPITAELTEIRVEEGDNVVKGDTLAVLDTTIVGANRRSALSAVKRAQANVYDLLAGSDKEKIMAADSRLQNTIANLDQAERDFKRAQELHSKNLINDQLLEDAELKLQTAKNNKRIATEELADLKRGARTHEVDAAQAVLDQAEAELSAVKKQFDDAFLTASISGIVHLVPYQVGELIPAGRSVVTLQSQEYLWIKIFVPEDKLDRVNVGDSLIFSVDAYPDKDYEAVVTYVSSSAEFTPRNVQTKDERLNLVFAVKLVVVPGSGQLRAGMPADFRL